MTATTVYTSSQEAYASVLLARSARWARGYRNSDGLQFVLFASSRRMRDGTPIYHMTAVDGSGCSCSGYRFRGACSHALACRRESERVREQVTRRATYEDIFKGSGQALTDAF
jgi:hypothetical protein